MKKILVLVMVLLLSGCQDETKSRTEICLEFQKTTYDINDVPSYCLNDLKDDFIPKECAIDLIDDILYDFDKNKTFDGVYEWSYDWRTETISYKNFEQSETRYLTVLELVENECS
jgi:hypothetical protein